MMEQDLLNALTMNNNGAAHDTASMDAIAMQMNMIEPSAASVQPSISDTLFNIPHIIEFSAVPMPSLPAIALIAGTLACACFFNFITQRNERKSL